MKDKRKNKRIKAEKIDYSFAYKSNKLFLKKQIIRMKNAIMYK